MSKRVEVREGDKWTMNKWGILHQIRGMKMRQVASTYVGVGGWLDGLDDGHLPVAAEFAKAAIIGFGGEWAEVAEEKKPEAGTLTMHVYEYRCDGLIVLYKSKREFSNADYLGTTTITIAGVTT